VRLSSDEKDRGYCALLPNDRCVVTLDGVQVRYAVTADEEAGYVIHYLRNEADEYYLVDGEPATETLFGKVVIVTPEGFPRNRLYWIIPRARELIRRWYRSRVYFLLYWLRSRARRIVS